MANRLTIITSMKYGIPVNLYTSISGIPTTRPSMLGTASFGHACDSWLTVSQSNQKVSQT